MMAYMLYIDETGVPSLTEVIGPSGSDVMTTKAADYTASNGAFIDADTSGGGWTLTLPTSGTVKVKVAPNLTIDGNGLTIDGADTLDATDYDGFVMTFRSSGTAWLYELSYLYGADA